MAKEKRETEHTSNAERPFWYQVLTIFPFLFFPIVALVGIFLSIVMPYLTGVRPR